MKEKTGGSAKAKSPALPCGVVDEPAKAGGTAKTSRASGFLATEACTPRGVATHLGKHWLNEPSAITSKAGNSNSRMRSYRFLVRFKVQHGSARSARLERKPRARSGRHQDAIEHPLEFAGALGHLAVACLVDVAAPEQLVGDIQRGEHRQARACRRSASIRRRRASSRRRSSPAAPRTPDPARCGSGSAARGSRPETTSSSAIDLRGFCSISCQLSAVSSRCQL